MARLFTKTDLERAARLAAHRTCGGMDVERAVEEAVEDVARDPLDILGMLVAAYCRGEYDALSAKQGSRVPEEAVRDLLP